MIVDPTPFQTTMIEERKDPGGEVKPIVSDSFLSFLNGLRAGANAAFNQVGNGIVGPGFRNLLVDGSFEVWDGSRALALAAATGYTGCTMWSYSSPVNFAQFTITRTAGLTFPSQFSLQWSRNAASAAVNTQTLFYDMESINSVPLARTVITLSFTARKGANYSGGPLVSSIQTGTGTDQAQRTAPYAGSVITSQINVLSSTAQRYTQSITVPVGTTQIGISFAWTPTGVSAGGDLVQIDDVQLESGTYATVFERLPFDVQRQRVFRYFWKTFPYDTTPAQAAGVAGALTFWQAVGAAIATACTITFPTIMRAIPTLVTFNPNAANIQIRNSTLGNDWTGTATVSATGNIAVAGFTNAGSAVGNINAVHVTADARI